MPNAAVFLPAIGSPLTKNEIAMRMPNHEAAKSIVINGAPYSKGVEQGWNVRDSLLDNKMLKRFLVSTTHCLLAIDPEGGLSWRVHSGRGLYFGLALDPECRIYVACRNTTLGPEDETIRASERGSVLVLDQSFRVCDELTPPFPLRDVHGIAWFDHRLWVTCSFDNMVAVYDCNSGDWSRWYPAPNPADRGRDVHHFNTVRRMDNQIWLVAHHFGPSELLVYDYPSLDLDSAIPLGRMAHDLFWLHGAVGTCSSAEGCLVNARGQRLRTGNFPRGVATTRNGNLLGISQNAARSERANQSGVLRWYTREWQFRADYVLPGVGMVLDLMAIEQGQYAWEAMEPWPSMEIAQGEYNALAAGNTYGPDFLKHCPDISEWHRPEATLCWTAARNASLLILISPGETRLRIEVSSAYPASYHTEIYLNGKRLGELVFEQPGILQNEFCIERDSDTEHKLTFRVPYLWKPAELIPESCDQRALGVAVHLITLRCQA